MFMTRGWRPCGDSNSPILCRVGSSDDKQRNANEGYNVHDGVDVGGVHVLGSIGLQSLGDGASELSLRAAAALAMDA
jgi:hypothetical protein